jgi:hypothetical protein
MMEESNLKFNYNMYKTYILVATLQSMNKRHIHFITYKNARILNSTLFYRISLISFHVSVYFKYQEDNP